MKEFRVVAIHSDNRKRAPNRLLLGLHGSSDDDLVEDSRAVQIYEYPSHEVETVGYGFIGVCIVIIF